MNEANTSVRYRQSDAMREIFEWSKDRALWQQDALQQLVSGTNSEEIDVDRLEKICIGARDDAVTMQEEDLAPQTSTELPMSLSRISGVAGVNALASNQELTFSPIGITIIYGDNGSGKSGYCRVLKHACRSRDRKIEIHPDIRQSTNVAQSALIEYNAGPTDRSVDWTPDSDTLAELGQISIFDARSANTHVQAENSVAYTPFPMRILEALGEFCDELKLRIDGKISTIQAQTPQVISQHSLSSTTAAGKFLGAISVKSDPEVLDLLCNLSEEKTRRLDTLRVDLSQDPKQTIRNLSAQQKRASSLMTAVTVMNQSIGDASLKELEELTKALRAAREASKTASNALFAASPLPDIGSDAWKVLWEAARAYSDGAAYPQKSYPDLSADSDLCVLCQQPLTSDAVARKKTFEDFVQGTTKATEQGCSTRLTAKTETLEAARMAPETLSAAVIFLRDELSLEDLAQAVLNWGNQARARLNSALNNDERLSVKAPVPTEQLEALKEEFQERINQLSEVDDPEARAKLEHEKQELDERLKLVDIKDDILAHIERLKTISGLKTVAKTTARRAVTTKNKELSEKLVTGVLRDRFAREIDKLRLNATPLELRKTRDSKAQSFFQVQFVGYPGQPLGDILSEGEHRCVALAAFLAELVTSKEYSGIVFDDPMSSLDHIYRVRVARRLAEEGQHRQVVIFTHDLGFLFEVKREAEARDVPLHYQHVKRKSDTPGHVEPELPLKAKEAPARVAALRSEMKDFKGQFNTVPEMRRVAWSKGIIEQLRETWDQVIADFIAPVLGRFDNKVKGGSMFKLLALTQSDVEIMNAARGRLSEDLHNVAGALNPEDVTHAGLSKEVDVIHDFIQSLSSRPKPAQPRIRFPLD